MKEKRIDIRVDGDEYEVIKRNADNAGLSVSQYVRAIARNKPVNPKVPLIDIQAYNALHGMANNLNQLARHANATGEIQIDELNRIVEELKTRII